MPASRSEKISEAGGTTVSDEPLADFDERWMMHWFGDGVSRPNTRVLTMSGRDPEVLRLKDGWAFLQKPFSPAQLVAAISDVLKERWISGGEPT